MSTRLVAGSFVFQVKIARLSKISTSTSLIVGGPTASEKFAVTVLLASITIVSGRSFFRNQLIQTGGAYCGLCAHTSLSPRHREMAS